MSKRDGDTVELRGFVDVELVAVCDILAQVRGTSRMDVVEQALKEFTVRKIHESTLVLRVTRGNGTKTEP